MLLQLKKVRCYFVPEPKKEVRSSAKALSNRRRSGLTSKIRVCVLNIVPDKLVWEPLADVQESFYIDSKGHRDHSLLHDFCTLQTTFLGGIFNCVKFKGEKL